MKSREACRMSLRVSIAAVIGLSAPAAAVAARMPPMLAQAAPQAPAAQGPSVRVTGAVATPLALTQADLKAFPPEHWVEAGIVRRSGDRDVDVRIRGVRLTAVLQRAGLANTDRNGWKHTVVLATATDGYKVAFSWAELFNTPAGAQVIVVLERDGRPVDDAEGPIALVAVQDIRRGPRSVRGLARLDVRVLGD